MIFDQTEKDREINARWSARADALEARCGRVNATVLRAVGLPPVCPPRVHQAAVRRVGQMPSWLFTPYGATVFVAVLAAVMMVLG